MRTRQGKTAFYPAVLLALLIGVFSLPLRADDGSPAAVLKSLFDAMRAGDGGAVRALVVPDARLDRLQLDGSLRSGTFEDWASWVDDQNAGDADEQVFGVQYLSRSDTLVTVWAPFTVRYKGKLVGCGVNQFTMARTAEGWRIVYGIDQPAGEDCESYPAKFD